MVKTMSDSKLDNEEEIMVIQVSLHNASLISMAILPEIEKLRGEEPIEEFALAIILAAEATFRRAGCSRAWDGIRSGVELLESQDDITHVQIDLDSEQQKN
jgi:hypothetical protein